MENACSFPLSADAPPSDPAPDRPEARARFAGETALERAERFARTLRRFTEVGLNLAEGLERKALADSPQMPDPEGEAEPAQALDGEAEADQTPEVSSSETGDCPAPEGPLDRGGSAISLSVYRLARLARLNIAFEIKIFEEYPNWGRQERAEQVRKTEAARREQDKRKKREILQAFGDAAESDKRFDREKRENLLDELRKELDKEEFEDELAKRSVNDIVAAILLECEIEPDWKELQAVAEVRAAWAEAVTPPGPEAAEPEMAAEEPAAPPATADAAAPEAAPEPPPATSGCDPP